MTVFKLLAVVRLRGHWQINKKKIKIQLTLGGRGSGMDIRMDFF